MTHSISKRLALFASTLIVVPIVFTTSAFAETQYPGTSGRQWSVIVRAGVTSSDGGEQPQFGVLLSHPGPRNLSYGIGVGYEQAYSLNIIPVFIDLRLASVAPDFLGGTPGLFFEVGYASVFGDTFDRDDLRLGAIRVREFQGLRSPPTIDGEGYYLNFGLFLTRRLNRTFSYVLEFGSKLQSVPPNSTSALYGLPNYNQNEGAGVLGGSSFDLEFPQSGRRGTLSSLSVTLGLRF